MFTLTMSNQGAAHRVLLAVVDKVPQCRTCLLHRMAMQVEAGLNFVLAHTQIFIHAVLHPRAGKLQRVEGGNLLDNTIRIEEVTLILNLQLSSLTPCQHTGSQLGRFGHKGRTLASQRFNGVAKQSIKTLIEIILTAILGIEFPVFTYP